MNRSLPDSERNNPKDAKFSIVECLSQIFEPRYDFIGDLLPSIDLSPRDEFFRDSIRIYFWTIGRGLIILLRNGKTKLPDNIVISEIYFESEFQTISLRQIHDWLKSLHALLHPHKLSETSDIINFNAEMYNLGYEEWVLKKQPTLLQTIDEKCAEALRILSGDEKI
jgi:hypothetical protein